MAFTVGAIAGKDGNSSSIGGGLLAADVAGGGVGPWFLFNGLVDGVAGSNKAAVTASNALKVDGSAVTQPVSLAAGATAIAKAEDAAAADADVGVPAMAVRKASPANTSGADGDYEMLQMSAGRLWVDASGVTLTVGSHAVTLAAGATAIAKAEDVASADADVGVPSMAVQKATPANTAGTDGDYEFLQMSAGRLWTSAVVTAGALSIGKAEDAASADGDVGVPAMAIRKATPANTSGTDGDWEALQMSGGRLWTNSLIGDGTNTLTLVQDAAGTNVWAVPVMIHPDSSGLITPGTAGTPSSQVMSMQGVASMTPVQEAGYQVMCTTSVTRPADTTAYTANDVWADSTSAPTSGGFTLTGAGRASGGSGVITDIMFTSSAVPGTLLQGELHVFNQAATAVNDNAAWNLSDSDALNRIAIVPFTLLADANNSYYHAQNLNIGFTCSGSANLRYLIKVKNAYTPISSEVLTVAAKIIQVT